MHNPTGKATYIVGLDILRFIAAILVVSYHFGFLIWAEGLVPVTYRWPAPVAWFGFVGVEIFFTLSGFVIAYTAVKATSFSFVRSRLARLTPGTAICSTLTLLTCLAFHSAPLYTLITEWLHSAILPVRIKFIDGSYWTLPVELAFYSLVLLLIFFRREQFLTRAMGAIGVLSSAVWIGLSILYANGGSALHWIYLLQTRQGLYFTLIPHGCLFAVGVLLWFCLTHKASRNRLILLAICIGGSLTETFWHSYWLVQATRNQIQERQIILPCLVWLLSVGVIIFSVKNNERISSRLGPFLTTIRWAGLLTYPLYLIHLRTGLLLIGALHSRIGDNASLFLITLIMLVVALLIAKYCEPPLRKLVQQWLDILHDRSMSTIKES